MFDLIGFLHAVFLVSGKKTSAYCHCFLIYLVYYALCQFHYSITAISISLTYRSLALEWPAYLKEMIKWASTLLLVVMEDRDTMTNEIHWYFFLKKLILDKCINILLEWLLLVLAKESNSYCISFLNVSLIRSAKGQHIDQWGNRENK